MKPIQHGILVGKEDRPLSGGRALILVEHSAETLTPILRKVSLPRKPSQLEWTP
jgi:hypothetical protein